MTIAIPIYIILYMYTYKHALEHIYKLSNLCPLVGPRILKLPKQESKWMDWIFNLKRIIGFLFKKLK